MESRNHITKHYCKKSLIIYIHHVIAPRLKKSSNVLKDSDLKKVIASLNGIVAWMSGKVKFAMTNMRVLFFQQLFRTVII